MSAATRSTRAKLAFHQGETLMRLSSTYGNLHKTVLEMIQNAIDASAKRVYVKLDLDKREAIVVDDGEGVTPEKFHEALRCVGQSVKPKTGSLGRFGLGLISPLGKVKSFQVLSIPRGSMRGNQWLFEPTKIKAMAEHVTIPVTPIDRLPFFASPWTDTVGWRTMMRLVGITSDKVMTIINPEDLENDILGAFGQAMRIKGTVCKIDIIEGGKTKKLTIKPRDYAGTPFEVVSLHGDDIGEVTFTLYRAKSRNGKRQGEVSLRQADDTFLLTWKHFVRQVRGHDWYNVSPVFEALGSGYFEGVISAKKIELDPGRTKFVANDALFELFTLIHEWYEQHGKEYLSDERERTAAERLQNLGLRSLERWNDLLDDDAYASLRKALEGTFVYGRLGPGHVDPAAGKPGEEQDKTSVRVGQGGAGKQREPREDDGSRPQHDEDRTRDPDRPGDIPLGAIGPRGSKRQLVRHDSIGLQIAHEPLNSHHLWELDAQHGILYFNTSDRRWERCEAKDAWVLHLQEWVIMQVLHLLLLPNEQFDIARQHVNQQSRCYIEQFICSAPPKRR